MSDDIKIIAIYRCSKCSIDIESANYTIEEAKEVSIPHKTIDTKSDCRGFFKYYKPKHDIEKLEEKIKDDIKDELRQNKEELKEDIKHEIKEEKKIANEEKKKIKERKNEEKEEENEKRISDLEPEFFRVDEKPYIAFRINGHREIRSMIGKPFRDYIGLLLNIKGNDRDELIDDWVAKSMHGGKEYKLYTRCTWKDDNIWYDMTNRDWSAIKVSKEGWEICEPPILFYRHMHQEEQIEPDKTAEISDIDKLFDLIRWLNDDDKILFKINLVSKFIPWMPHPIDVTFGPYGSTKSSDDRFKKSIVDPSKLTSIGMGQSVLETVQTAAHHYYLNLDNISILKEWQSDTFCRICTGEGISKRKLYTDDEDKIFYFRHCISLNGLSNPVNKADLLDRCIIFEKPLFDDNQQKRLREVELEEIFKDIKPKVMGSIFKILSRAMNIQNNIKLDKLPRMADFFIWGCAISEAMGINKEIFSRIYYDNIKNKSKDILDMDVVADILFKIFDGYVYEAVNGNQKEPAMVTGIDKWKGTMTELLEMMTIVCQRTYKKIPKDFPDTAISLATRIDNIIPNLHLSDIQIIKEREKSHRGRRIITITNIKKNIKNDKNDIVVGSIESSNEMNYMNYSHDFKNYDLNNNVYTEYDVYVENVIKNLNEQVYIDIDGQIFNNEHKFMGNNVQISSDNVQISSDNRLITGNSDS